MTFSPICKLAESLEDVKMELCGYVPQRADKTVIGNSGVTICRGVDLGQQGEKEISSWPESVKTVVKPYLGLTKQAAVAALARCPLKITETEAEIVQDMMEKAALEQLSKHYGEEWGTIPSCIQSVLFSLSWQLGHIWYRKDCTVLWNAAKAKQWNNLVAEIYALGRVGYSKRRNTEASFIVKGLKNAIV